MMRADWEDTLLGKPPSIFGLLRDALPVYGLPSLPLEPSYVPGIRQENSSCR